MRMNSPLRTVWFRSVTDRCPIVIHNDRPIDRTDRNMNLRLLKQTTRLKQGRRIDSGLGNPLNSLTVSSPVPPFSLSTFLSADFEQSTLAERIYLSWLIVPFIDLTKRGQNTAERIAVGNPLFEIAFSSSNGQCRRIVTRSSIGAR